MSLGLALDQQRLRTLSGHFPGVSSVAHNQHVGAAPDLTLVDHCFTLAAPRRGSQGIDGLQGSTRPSLPSGLAEKALSEIDPRGSYLAPDRA